MEGLSQLTNALSNGTICEFFGYPLLSQQRVKLRTSNFVRTFTGSIGTKAHENVRNSSRGHIRETRNFSGHPCMYRAYCAVVFAIAQLSCFDILSTTTTAYLRQDFTILIMNDYLGLRFTKEVIDSDFTLITRSVNNNGARQNR